MRISLGNVVGAAALSAGAMVMMASTDARAAYIATVTEVGADVVAVGTGTINTTGLSFQAPQQGNVHQDTGYTLARGPAFGVGSATPMLINKYTGAMTGPANFGAGRDFVASSGGGDTVQIARYANILDVPAGYVSSSLLSGTSTFANHTFASLGMTPGTYTWTWGSGLTADSYTLVIGAVPVPEPTSLALLGLGAVGLLARKRR